MNKKVLFTIAASFSLAIFITCSQVYAQKGIPFYLIYDLEEVIRDQSKVATITSTQGLIIDSIIVLPQNFRSVNTGFFKKQTVNADVLPGEYTVAITHSPTGENLQFSTTTLGNVTTVYYNHIPLNPVTFNFEAGHVYVVEQHLFKVRVREVTKEKTLTKIVETRNNAVFESIKK